MIVIKRVLSTLAVLLLFQFVSAGVMAEDHEADTDEIKVKITEDLAHVDVKDNGKTIRIMRNQDLDNMIHPYYAKTARECPPFCIQPIVIHPGVETVGVLEVLDYLKEASDGGFVSVIDSRTPDWRVRGTIPGSVSIPWTHMGIERAPKDMANLLEFHFNVTRNGDYWDFRNAKTLVLFCNGYWCPQSPTNIRSLLAVGYPEDKIKWYRGGMQEWEQLGLTTVVPDE